MNFDYNHPKVNLLDRLPGFGEALRGRQRTPLFLKERFENMEQPTKRALTSMNDLPARIAFLPGVAGCGKTRTPIDQILFTLYGTCGSN